MNPSFSAKARCLAMAILCANATWASDTPDLQGVNIEQQPLAAALREFSQQTGLQIGYAAELAANKVGNGVHGVADPAAALALLLARTGLEYRFVNANTVVIRAATDSESTSDTSSQAPRQGDTGTGESSEPAAGTNPAGGEGVANLQDLRDFNAILEDEVIAKESRGLMDVITVIGSRNVGIRRFEDDPQPYVVFNAAELQQASSANLEDFLRTRLPQNTAQTSNQQFTTFDGSLGNTSSINLRGLGANQTLILVNGRRAPRVSFNNGASADFQQADINGIPTALVERIEVLPATASGIYGGGATGGVINIITRRDYSGGEFQVRYGDTFNASFEEYNVDGSYGFSLEEGKTHIVISGSYSETGTLLAGERPFGERSFDLVLRNNPAAITDGFIPPLAAMPNIRSPFGNLVLDDGTDLGSNLTSVPQGYAGIGSDQGQALIDNAGRYNLDPSPDFDGLRQPIRQAPTAYSTSFALRREFTPELEIYLDAWFSRTEAQRRGATLPRFSAIPGSAPGNPFQGTVIVTYPAIGPSFSSEVTQETLQYVGGLTYDLPGNWSVSADYNWSRARTESVSTSPGFDVPFGVNPAIAAGTIDLFRDLREFPVDLSPFAVISPNNIVGPRDTILKNFAVRASGPVFETANGPINLSMLLESREEVLDSSFNDSYDFLSGVPGELNTVFIPERRQSTDSVYVEGWIPVLGGQPWVQSLALQLSGRYDKYETKSPSASLDFPVDGRGQRPTEPIETAKNDFSSFDFTLGLRYEITDDVLVRASYGTGFLPPSVNQIFAEEDPNFFVVGDDPRRGGQPIFIQTNVKFGGNPDLEPEESESWSFGLILTPRFIPGFRFSADYSEVEKSDEILFPTNQQILNAEDTFPERVVRAPLTPADIAAGFTGGEITFFDRSAINFAKTKSTALDLQLDQVVETKNAGLFRFYAVATHMRALEAQLTPDSEVVDRVGFDNGPLEWRANFGITWDSPGGAWTLGWNTQYYDSYAVYSAGLEDGATVELQKALHGRGKIPSEAYHDFFARYRPDADGMLKGVEIHLGIQNVFDKIPAARPGFSATDGRFSAYGDNRLRRFALTLRKTFQ